MKFYYFNESEYQNLNILYYNMNDTSIIGYNINTNLF